MGSLIGSLFDNSGGNLIVTDLEVDGTTLSIDATNNRVGMGTIAPGTQLQVESNAPYVTLKNDTAENTAAGCESRITFEDHGNNALGQIEVSHVGTSDDEKGQLVLSTNNDDGLQAALTISEAQNVGIGDVAPKVSLNVIHDYHTTTFETQLTAGGQGGGQILRFGSSATLVLGGLYYLKSDGVWTATMGTAVATGATQLLGISMGTNAQVGGLLLTGFVRIPGSEILNTPGSGVVEGLPLYVSKTEVAHLDFTAPAAGSDFVRVVGYAIDDDSSDILVYFNPDSTHVEL